MATKTYSLKTDGDKYIAPHFRVREFRSKCGADKILISEELVEMLEKLREKLGCSININSGYRTEAHNRNIGGSLTSKHCLGLAADIVCKKDGKTLSAKEVCCAAQDLGFPGIAYICSGATHLDVRNGKWWADESRNDRRVTDFYTYFGIERKGECPWTIPTAAVRYSHKGNGVRWMQWHLIKLGFSCGKSGIDGSFGPSTLTALKKFQKAYSLEVDGICGPATKAKLLSLV